MKTNLTIAVIIIATQVFAGQPDVTKQYEAMRKQVEAYGMAAYSNGLIAAGFQYKKDANLNAYLVIQAEQKRFAENPSIEAGVTNANLAIREVAVKSLNDYNVKLAGLLRLYVTNLMDNVRSLMLANKIDEAKAVKEKMTAVEFELALLEPKLPKVVIEEKLTIIKATFGAGKHWADITKLVQQSVTNGKLQFVNGPDWYVPYKIPDPIWGVNKSVKIVYQVNGKKSEKEWVYGEMIILPVGK